MSGMRAMELAEVRRVLPELPVKYGAIVSIGVTTGCRISEILVLRRFDLLNADGRLKETIAFLKLKSRSGRVEHRKIGIPRGIWRRVVLEHLKRMEESGYDRPDDFVFRGSGGKHLSRLTCARFFRSRLGPGYGTHWMRKTFAGEMFRHFLEDNVRDPMRALELVRQALGHARIDTTVKYLGITEASIESAQEAIFNGGGER